MMQREIHLKAADLLNMCQVRPGDFGKFAIIPGPKDRAEAIMKNLTDTVKNFSFYEYAMYTGFYNGIRITTGNGGRFSPDSAIISDLLCNGGVEFIIRIGSCGALREDIGVGDVIIVDKVIRGDGASLYYVKEETNIEADKDIMQALESSCQKQGVKYHVGPIWTTDALLRETKEIVNKYIQQGAIGVDMVSSSMLTIAQFYNKKAASISVVSDNLISGEVGFTDMRYYAAESKIIQVALEAVKELARK